MGYNRVLQRFPSLTKREYCCYFMAHQGNIEIDGEVVECLPNTLFRVKLANNHIVLCHLSGKMRLHFIRIMPGDKVKLEMSPYDADKGRITYRMK